MAIAIVALKARDQHERPLRADDAHDVAQHVLASPLDERFLEPLREAVVDDRGEVLLIDAVVLVGAEQFFGANQPEAVEQLRSDRVVAGLAAIERQQRDARALAAAQHREQSSVLVVRMRGGVHDARDRLQLQQLLPRAGGASILGKRIGAAQRDGESGDDDQEREASQDARHA